MPLAIGIGLSVTNGGGALVAPPVNTVAPSISGTAAQGGTLTAANGTWTGSPTSYTYQWKRGGSAIGGATSQTYVVAAGDIGTSITVTVTATNAGGSASATSAGTTILATFVNPISTSAAIIFDGRDGLDTYAAGAAIDTWPDKSGNGRDATQGTAGKRPVQTTLNGYPAAFFNAAVVGVLQLGTALFTQNQPLTYFVVIKRTANDSNHYIVRGGVTGNPAGLFTATNDVQMYAGTATTPAQTIASGTIGLLTAIFNGASSEFRLNGANPQTGNPGSAGMSSASIGSSTAALQGADVVIAAWYVYPGALNSTDRAAVEAYLTARYGPFS